MTHYSDVMRVTLYPFGMVKLPLAGLLLLLLSPVRAALVGQTAPDLDLTDLAGGRVALSALKGKVVFVHFWASWCGPCAEEFPKLNALASELGDKDFALLAVNVDAKRANVDKFLARHVKEPLKAKVLLDPSGKSPRDFANRAMPCSYVLDKEGVVRFVHMGFMEGDEARWRAEVSGLRAKK